MAGTTVSFMADPALAACIGEIARVDGVTRNQAAARASALGVLLSPAARRALRLVLDEGGNDARQLLAVALAKAVAQVGNRVLERQLLAHADVDGLASAETEEEVVRSAVKAVADHRRKRAGEASRTANGQETAPSP